jgi:hypothetical protein
MDLIEIDDVRNAPEELENEIPLEDLIRQHNLRYDVRTSIGTVRLRFIGALRRRAIELTIAASDPLISGKREDLRTIAKIIKERPDDERPRSDQMRIEAALEPSFYELFAGAFDVPRMRSGSDVEAFASALDPKEWHLMRVLLMRLIAARPAGTVATSMIELCAKYGVKISDNMTLENMTAQQMAVLDQTAEREYAAMKQAVEATRP